MSYNRRYLPVSNHINRSFPRSVIGVAAGFWGEVKAVRVSRKDKNLRLEPTYGGTNLTYYAEDVHEIDSSNDVSWQIEGSSSGSTLDEALRHLCLLDPDLSLPLSFPGLISCDHIPLRGSLVKGWTKYQGAVPRFLNTGPMPNKIGSAPLATSEAFMVTLWQVLLAALPSGSIVAKNSQEVSSALAALKKMSSDHVVQRWLTVNPYARALAVGVAAISHSWMTDIVSNKEGTLGYRHTVRGGTPSINTNWEIPVQLQHPDSLYTQQTGKHSEQNTQDKTWQPQSEPKFLSTEQSVLDEERYASDVT